MQHYVSRAIRVYLVDDHGRAAALDDVQRELVRHVVDGLTDDQIAEVTSRPVEAVSADVLDLLRLLIG